VSRIKGDGLPPKIWRVEEATNAIVRAPGLEGRLDGRGFSSGELARPPPATPKKYSRIPARTVDVSAWPTAPLRWNGVDIIRDVPELEAFAIQQYPNLAIDAPQIALFFRELNERGAFDPRTNQRLASLLEGVARLCPSFPAGVDGYDPRWRDHEDALSFVELAQHILRSTRLGAGRALPPGRSVVDQLAEALGFWLFSESEQRFGVIERERLESVLGALGSRIFDSFSDPICEELGLPRLVTGPIGGQTEAQLEAELARLQRLGQILDHAPKTRALAIPYLLEQARQNPALAAKLRELAGSVGRPPERRRYPKATDRGLNRLLRFGVLPIIPRTSQAPPTFEEVEVTRQLAPAALEKIIGAVEFREHMPLIDCALELCPAGMLEGVQAVCVQHGLATQWPVFRGLEQKGLRPENTQIISAPYSGSPLVQERFRRAGYGFETPLGRDPKESLALLERRLEEALEKALERAEPGKPILVLDDGGHASRLIAQRFKADAHRFRVVEQTTRGLRQVEKLGKISFVCRSIAANPLKKYEARQVAEDSFLNVDRTFSTLGMSPLEGQPLAVIGYGTIGRGLALLGRERDCEVGVWDQDPEKRARARAEGFFAPDDPALVLKERYLVLGATGEQSIGSAEAAMMDSGTVIGSVSSVDVEIEDLTQKPGVEAVTVSTQGPGDARYVNRLWRFADKDLLVLRNRFPVTFNGGIETGKYDGFEQTRAAMILGIADAMSATDPGLADVRPALTRDFVFKAGERGLAVKLPKEYLEELRRAGAQVERT